MMLWLNLLWFSSCWLLPALMLGALLKGRFPQLQRTILRLPRLDAAIQYCHGFMSQPTQHPPQTCGNSPARVIVGDNLSVRSNALFT